MQIADSIFWVTLIGLMAGTLTTVAYLPQLIKVWRSRSTSDVSLEMLIIMNLGLFLWLIYGTITLSLPIILANAVTLALALAILTFKIRYK